MLPVNSSVRQDLPKGTGLSLYREVGRLALPASASMISYSLMGLADTLMVGQLGPAALGGVGLSNTLLFTATAPLFGIVGAVAPLVAQNLGAGRRDVVGGLLHQAQWVAVVIGGLVALVLGLGAELWMHLLRPAEEVQAAGAAYLVCRALGLPIFFVLVARDHLLEGMGDTATPMRISLVTNALHIGLMVWWVGGGLGLAPLGVQGAALSTVFSQAVGVLIHGWLLGRRHRREPVWGLLPLRGPRWEGIHQLLRVGWPMGLQFTADVAGWFVMSTFLGWLGAIPLAAGQVVMRMIHVPMMISRGVTVAATALVGRAVGAGDLELARRVGWAAITVGVLVTLPQVAAFLLWAEVLAGWFTSDPEVVVLAAWLLRVSMALVLAETFCNAAWGMLQGAGDTKYPMWTMIVVTWGIGVPLSWVLTFGLGLGAVGVFASLGAQMFGAAALYVRRIRGEAWLGHSLVEARRPEVEPVGEIVIA